ncbi:hypothetical protein Hanom_Chr00s000002g01599941 [Helianthus anomalus]
MFVHLTKRTEFFVRVRSFIKRTNTNELPAERFINRSLKVKFVCRPKFNLCVLSMFVLVGSKKQY